MLNLKKEGQMNKSLIHLLCIVMAGAFLFTDLRADELCRGGSYRPISYYKELEKGQLKRYGELVQKKGFKNSVMQLTLLNGNNKTLVSPALKKGAKYKRYDDFYYFLFLGYIEGYYIIQQVFNEGVVYLLISQKSGKEYRIGGFPRLSPDKSKFITVEADEAGFSHQGIQLWSLEGDEPRLLDEVKPKGYNMHNFVSWNNNNLVVMRSFQRADASLCPNTYLMDVKAIATVKKSIIIKESKDDTYCCRWDNKLKKKIVTKAKN